MPGLSRSQELNSRNSPVRIGNLPTRDGAKLFAEVSLRSDLKLIDVSCDKFAHGQRLMSRDLLHVAGEAIVTIGGMKSGHYQKMLVDVFGQIAFAQFIAPLFQRHVNVSHLPARERRWRR